MGNPSPSEWAKLYQIAGQFQKVSPWTWMVNGDLFAVVNPQNGEVGYCSILGNGKEEFGLGIFLGDKGYKRYLSIFSDKPGVEEFDETIMTPMLSLLFANREDLQRQDIEVIRSLGLQFRGKNAWPLFRSQKPGYAPWFLEKEEAIFLTVAIEQALAVAGKVRDDKLDLYEGVDEDLVFTRYYSDGKWKEDWRKPEFSQRSSSKKPEESTAIVNEAEMLLLRNSSPRQGGSWELDISILPIPIGPKSSRPYFPLCFLAVERQQGMVIGVEMNEPWITQSQQREVFIKILKNAGQLPHDIRVKSKKVKEILEPIAISLGINIPVGAIPKLERFKASLDNQLSG